MKYGDTFELIDGSIARVTGIYAQGIHYHTLNFVGDCIAGEKYLTHSEFNLLRNPKY